MGKIFWKTFWVGFLVNLAILFFLMFNIGCGGSKSSATVIAGKCSKAHGQGSAPVISVPFERTISFMQGESAGLADVGLAFTVKDKDGDVVTVTLSDWNGTRTIPAIDVLGGSLDCITETQILPKDSISTKKKGDFKGQVYVTDSAGHKSNTLSYSVSVY